MTARPGIAGRPLAALALAGALAGLCTQPLSAQSAPPADSVPTIDLGPVLDAAPDPSPETPRPAPKPIERLSEAELTLPQYDRAATAGAAPVRPDDLLLPIRPQHPTLNGIVRLSGEVQTETFFIDLPEAVAARDVVLSYRIAINVLPEASQLRIRVNGSELAPVRPDAFEGFEQLILPGDMLVTGLNDITVTAENTHRIFCGPEATFAVWTEIDANTSGVRIARRDLATDPAGLAMALRAQLALSGSIPVRLSDPADSSVMPALARHLSGVRDAVPVLLEIEPPYGVTDAAARLARITVLHGASPNAQVRRGADGTVVLVLTLGPDGAAPDLGGLLPLPALLPNIVQLAPGTTTTLAALGFDQNDAFNRYSEQQITFRLPDEWLILASQKATLWLDYHFADGLPKGAIMLVKVDETTVRLLPLDQDGGKLLPPLDIVFPARLLVPGANALTFTVIVPGDPPDLPCPPIGGPLLTIGGDSTLLVPPSPRMRMAGLARPLVSLRPDQIRIAPGEAENADLDALLANLATALRPLEATSRIGSAGLTLVTGTGTGEMDLGDLGIGRRDLLQLVAAPRPGPAGALVADAAPRAAAGAPGPLTRAWTLAASAATWLGRLAVPGDGDLATWLEGRHAEAVLFLPEDEAPESMWLLVRPQADPRQIAAILAQSRLSAQGPRGRLSILTADGKWQSWHSTRTAPSLDEPLTIANFRAVAGNYASWSPLYYGILLLILTIVSVSLALLFLVTTRGRGKK